MAFLLRATTHWFSKDEVVAALELEERVSQSFDRAILLFYLADGSAKEGDLESARQLLTQVSHYRELTTASAQRAEILRWVSTFELSFMLGVPRQAMEAVLLEARSSNSDLLAAQCWILLMGIADNSCDLLGGRKLFADGMAHCAERDLIGPMTMLQGFERRFGLNSIATKNR